MKKCPWCGKEIPDDSYFCQYCEKVVSDPQKTTENNGSLVVDPEPPAIDEKETPEALKWHEKLFFRAIFIGVCFGLVLCSFNSDITAGITNIIIYFFIYLITGSIWRSANKLKMSDPNGRKTILRAEFGIVILAAVALNLIIGSIFGLL